MYREGGIKQKEEGQEWFFNWVISAHGEIYKQVIKMNQTGTFLFTAILQELIKVSKIC